MPVDLDGGDRGPPLSVVSINHLPNTGGYGSEGGLCGTVVAQSQDVGSKAERGDLGEG